MITGQTYKHKADSWSFGVILFQLLTGELPFHENMVEEKLPQVEVQAKTKRIPTRGGSGKILVPQKTKHSDDFLNLRKPSKKNLEPQSPVDNELNEKEKKLEDGICNQEPDYSLIKKRGHSELVIELVQKLLKKDPDTRLTMKAANIHPWFSMRMEINGNTSASRSGGVSISVGELE